MRPPRARAPARPASRALAGLPSRDDLAGFIAERGETDTAAIAERFGVKGADRRALRQMLKEMQADGGGLARRGRRGVAAVGAFPLVGVAEVASRDADGDLWVRLLKAADDLPAVRLAPGRDDARAGAPGLGDRVLARFEPDEAGETVARLIKRLGQSAHRILGVIRKARREIRVEPVDRKVKESLLLTGPEAEALRDGDLVLAAVGTHADHRYGPKPGKLIEVVGREDQPRAASLIALHSHGVPTGFSQAAEEEAEAAVAPTLAGRTDLRDLPFVTIDPADARDHDDAVFAQADEDPENEGGWVVWVAIADVAAYVRPGAALDREAWTKGNSVYFPDRVEPMLPERLSAGLCSLHAGEARAALAVRMVFDSGGTKTTHRFVRALIRCAAGISYEQAQDAAEGRTDDATGPLWDHVLQPLWAAYFTLKRGRDRRSPLAIASAERRIRLDAEGEIASIERRSSLEAHKLIEEMMVQANVCAAETLERAKTPLVFRVHESPSEQKLFDLADFLSTLDMPWTKGQPATTERFNRLLAETREGPHADIVNEVVLRSQMQAIYSPDNVGHFGLNLARYAHFTSPIRRYADLVVHRALIRALKLGDDGLTDAEIPRLPDTAEHITATERRAMAAERDATDRYVAAFLSDRVGAEFAGRITGVTRFGLFVRLDETGADGFVPAASLGAEYFVHDDRSHALVGERTGVRYPLGRRVEVRLKEATPLTGGLLLEMLSEPDRADPNAPPAAPGGAKSRRTSDRRQARRRPRPGQARRRAEGRA